MPCFPGRHEKHLTTHLTPIYYSDFFIALSELYPPLFLHFFFCKHSHKNWATLYQSMRVLSARRFTRNCVRKRNPKTFSQFDALDNYSVSYARVISRLPVALLHFPHVVNMRSRSQTNAVAVLPATLDSIVVVWCVVMGSCFWYKTFMITPCVVWSLIHVRHHNEFVFLNNAQLFPYRNEHVSCCRLPDQYLL